MGNGVKVTTIVKAALKLKKPGVKHLLKFIGFETNIFSCTPRPYPISVRQDMSKFNFAHLTLKKIQLFFVSLIFLLGEGG